MDRSRDGRNGYFADAVDGGQAIDKQISRPDAPPTPPPPPPDVASHHPLPSESSGSRSDFSSYFLVAAAAASAQAEAARAAGGPSSSSPPSSSSTTTDANALNTAARPPPSSVAVTPPLPYLDSNTPFPMPLGSRVAKPALGSAQARRRPDRLDKVRCCWAILSTVWLQGQMDLKFMYVDPTFSDHLSLQSSALIGTSFFDYIHPEERGRTEADMKNIIGSRTLFGSVTRCRYSRLQRMRSLLGAKDGGGSGDKDQRDRASREDRDYLPIDIVVNWIGADMALCFFHAIIDESAQDNDESRKTDWSNWCGTQPGSFDQQECQAVWERINRNRALNASQTGPEYVFQILAGPSDSMQAPSTSPSDVLFSWPPPRLFGLPTNDALAASAINFADGSYFVDDFARLAQGVNLLTMKKELSDANTSCTRRFRAKHTLTTEGMVRSVESVLIPYGSIILACFSVTYAQMLPGSSAASTASLSAPFGDPFAKSQPPIVQSVRDARLGAEEQQARRSNDASAALSLTSLVDSSVSQSHKEEAGRMGDEAREGQGSVATLAAVAAAAAAQTKRCASCGTSNSPEWRKGPDGTKSLCNACGLRFSRNISRAIKREERARLAAEVAANGGIIPPHLRKKPGAGLEVKKSGGGKKGKAKGGNGKGQGVANNQAMATAAQDNAEDGDQQSIQLARAAAQAAAAAGLRAS